MKHLLTILLFTLSLACKKQREDPPDADGCAPEQRIGCACRDGSGWWFPQGQYSSQCVGRGGVQEWRCN